MVDPHKVRPCNWTDRLPYHIEIDPEGFIPVFIGRLAIWPFGGPSSD